MNIQYLDSDFGVIEIAASESGITALTFRERNKEEFPNSYTQQAAEELSSYFSGHLQKFTVPLDFGGASDFFISVWNQLLNIDYGKTRTYLDIALEIGDRNAVRAVGMANGKNPIAIIVPCHRVVGSDRSLTGYAHGVDVKQRLLALENPKSWAMNGSLF